jgi:putative ABC transport system permease protein
VTVEVLEGRRRVRTLPVAAVVEELIGMAGYANPEEIARLTGETTVSGAFLQVSADRRPALFGRLKHLPAIAGVGLREAAREGFERTIAESFAISITSIVLFAVIIAFGVVYNSGQIALQERGRELASLRVLGFTQGETTVMLLGEQAALTLLAIPLGTLIGYGFILLIVTRFESEIFRLPMVLAPSAVGFGMIVLLAAAAISAVVVGRRVHRLDLIAVLKTRE